MWDVKVSDAMVRKTMSKNETAVVYPEITIEKYIGGEALTVQKVKDLLDWQEEGEGVKFGEDYLFKDHAGRKIRLGNNTHNRPIDMTWVKELKQNHLRKTFRFNGETMIIGANGGVLSAQHRCVSFIMAEQQRDASPDTWGKEPLTMETIVVYGVSEDPDTVRTIDNVKPRTLADVLYTDPELFGKMSSKDRATITKYLESAIRKVRFRTHADKDAYRPRRTHAEEVAFLDIHEKLKKAVKHIHEENKPIVEKTVVGDKEEKKTTVPLSTLKINPGSAAGLLYLMAASEEPATDGDAYRNLLNDAGDSVLAMKKVKFGRWDAACQFWSLICDVKTSPPPLMPLRRAIAALYNPNGEGGGSAAEREALVIKAWNAWINDEELTSDVLKLDYTEPDANGNRTLINQPIIGGIDFGVPKKETSDAGEGGEEGEEAEEDTTNDTGMTEAEVEERKEAARLQKELDAAAPPEKKKGRPVVRK